MIVAKAIVIVEQIWETAKLCTNYAAARGTKGGHLLTRSCGFSLKKKKNHFYRTLSLFLIFTQGL